MTVAAEATVGTLVAPGAPTQANHQTARARLSSGTALAQHIEALSRPDALRFSLGVTAHLGAWALGIAAVWALQGHAGWQALIAVLLGSQLHALTVLQHDCGHRSAYASVRANLWVGRLLAWFIFMPFTTFTELHRWHHGFLGDPKRDPDEWFYLGGPRQLFLRECLFMPRFVWLSLTHWPLSPEARGRVLREVVGNALLWSAVAAGLVWLARGDVLLWGFAVPMAWLGLVFNPISRGYEHFPMACLDHADPRRKDLCSNTITVTSPQVGLLWAYITFHVEHHLYPRVPFHRLPELHRMLRGKGQIERRWPLQGMRDFVARRL